MVQQNILTTTQQQWMVPTVWTLTMMKNILHQNKKLITILNDQKNITWRGLKMLNSKINGSKFYSNEYKDDLILESTGMAMYMVGNQNN